MRHPAKCLLSVFAACTLFAGGAAADSIPVEMLDPNLQVTTVLDSGIAQPIGIVFLGEDDFLVLEKASGQVKRVVNGVVQATPVLDLAVNSNSERGLLSLVLHPNFPTTPWVYVRWTESSTGADSTSTPPYRCSATASTVSSGTARRWRSIATSSCCEPCRPTIFRCQATRDEQRQPGRQPQRRRDAIRSRRKAVHLHG